MPRLESERNEAYTIQCARTGAVKNGTEVLDARRIEDKESDAKIRRFSAKRVKDDYCASSPSSSAKRSGMPVCCRAALPSDLEAQRLEYST